MAYKYYSKITIDNTKVEADHTNFPVCFQGVFDGTGGEADLRDTANSGHVENVDAAGTISGADDVPADLVFSLSPDGSNPLAHEIELYVKTTGQITAWVKIPTMDADADLDFYVCYGDSAITASQEDISNVWTNYDNVYHFGQTSGALDSKGGDDLTEGGGGGITYRQAGKTGYAVNFDSGADSHLKNDSLGNMFAGQWDWQITALMKLTDRGADQYAVCSGANDGVYIRYYDTNQAALYKIDDGVDDDSGTSTTDPSGAWAVYTQALDDSANDHLGYLDGVEEYNGANTDVGGLADRLYIGNKDTGGVEGIDDGDVCEVRVRGLDFGGGGVDSGLGANYIKTEANSLDPDNFVTVASETRFVQVPAGTLTVTGYAPTVTLGDGIALLAETSTGVWTDITSDLVGNITGKWGFRKPNPVPSVANTGEMRFVLNNSTPKYVPGITGALSGFDKGTVIKMVITDSNATYTRFRGVIKKLDPLVVPKYGERVRVTVADWLDYAATHPLLSPAIASSKRGDEMLTTVVADMPIAPQNTSYATGVNTFDTAFDTLTEKTTAYREMAKISTSELAPIYLQKDQADGETLVLENEHTRNGTRTADFTLDNTMEDIELAYGENVINYAQAEAFPRSVAGSISVLFETESRIRIGGNETIEDVRCDYRDPNGGAPAVGANMITPVSTTDFTVYTNKDGTGSDITSDMTVTADYGASGVTYKFENANGLTGWIWIRARGYLVNKYNSVSKIIQDSASQDEYGYLPLSIKQKYQQEIHRGRLKAASIVEWERNPRLVPKSVTFIPSNSSALMDAWLQGKIGDVVRVKEDDYEIDNLCYIEGVQFTIIPGQTGGFIMCKWILQVFLAIGLGLSPIKAEFDAGSNDAVEYGYLPEISGENVGARTISAWIYPHAIPSYPTFYTIVSDIGGENHGTYLSISDTGSGGYLAVFNAVWTSPGGWISPMGGISANTLYHVLFTHDWDDVDADPEIWINGVSVTVTEDATPSGTFDAPVGMPFIIGNSKFVNVTTDPLEQPFDGPIYDVRAWNRILTNAEIATIYGGGDVTSGLVFQGPMVRTAELSDFEDKTLVPASDRLLEGVFGRVAIPRDNVITRLIP